MTSKTILALLSCVLGVATAAAVPHSRSFPRSTAGLNGSNPVVDLGYSQYKGTTLGAGVDQYLGLRFAAAPLGELRWRAPQDPPNTTDVQPADTFGDICLGPPAAFQFLPMSEDCLFINIWAPSNATATSKLPVWFFIQGGGYAANSNANYNGTEVVTASNHSIVLASINYRVGTYGFLASEKVRKDGDLNVGLLDQRKALQWVKQYIHLFGGDNDHVVIHGDSAGAGSVAHHLTAYGGRDDGLFVGAISESPFFPTQRTVANMEFQFDRFAMNVSCNPNASDVMSCLRSKDTNTLQIGDVDSPFPGGENTPTWYFLPVIDGDLSRGLLYDLLEQGQMVRVPTMVGDDTSEGESFAANAATNAEFLQYIKDNYPQLSDSDIRLINATYPNSTPAALHNAWFEATGEAYGDSTFKCPGNQISESVAKYLSPQLSWNYHYDVVDPFGAALGAPVPHTTEITAVFGANATGCTGTCSYADGQVNAPMVPIVMDYWISFIRSLNPNTDRNSAAPDWQPWGSDGYNRLHFLLNGSMMETVPADQKNKCNIWRGLVNDTKQ